MRSLKNEAQGEGIATDTKRMKTTRSVHWKPSVILIGIVASMLSGASPAFATTDTGNQNPDFTVRVSLDPDVATDGDTVHVVLSVRDNKPFSFRTDEVKLNITLETPLGASFTVSFTVYLFPGTGVTLPFSYTVNEYFPRGFYALTLEAIEVDDPAAAVSSATATIALI
jgi:hypothetical protein